jgi:signal transduction histidine kinase/ligand-binding sensor domain-containing protein
LAFLLAACPCAFALDPTLDVSQYAHMSWKIREGFTKGIILSMAQTPDGYLWLGTDFALVRFDGVRTVAWQPPRNQSLPSSEIDALLAARDGTLWIGTSKGLASWKDGKLTEYPQLAGQKIRKLLQDRDDTVWAGALTFPPPGKLCAIHSGSVQCFGEDGSLGHGVLSLFEDNKGNLWAGGEHGLWRWKPGAPKFYPLPDPNSVFGLAGDRDGSLLISMRGGIRRFVDGKAEMAYPFPSLARQFEATQLLRDRDGGLWFGTRGLGLVHVHHGRTDVFAQSDGLSSENVMSLFEDREGSIWVGTYDGLDRFRELAVPTISVKQGLSNVPTRGVLAAKDGSVWLASGGDLNRSQNGQIITFGLRNGKRSGVAAQSLFQDSRGRVWVSTPLEFGHLENDRFIPVKGLPAGTVNGIAEDTAGDLWIANEAEGLFQISSGNVVQQIPWARLGYRDAAGPLAADPVRGGLWLGLYEGGLAYFSDGQIRASYSLADGLGEGYVSGLRLDQNGTLWAATEGGLSRLKDGRIATLRTSNGLPCNGVYSTVEDDAHALWVNTTCGLVRIVRPELDAWLAQPNRAIQVTLFDNSDGVRVSANFFGGLGPPVTKTSDGKLWFRSVEGVDVVDPQHLAFNNIPPPVHIEQLIADRTTYDTSSPVSLPPLVRELEIDYTALSLLAPEKNRFRIKLEGWDHDWQDMGNRRQVFYSNLAPRSYRFRVVAANNSGVWNETGASFDFAIAPAYYQTTWFRVSAATVLLALLWTAHQLRLRQLERQFNRDLEARVNERTRIARELHDTLLQGFHGVTFHFQAAANVLPDRPLEAKQRLEIALKQATHAIREGRDAIQDLRTSTTVTNDLAVALSTLGEELATTSINDTHTEATALDVSIHGTPRALDPIIGDDIYRIGSEALRNAFRHARAGRIEVEIRYDDRHFQLHVRDDGQGIDAAVLNGHRAGHFGLPGMRERAELLGGQFEVWSETGMGTEVDLTIPSAKAYATSSGRRSRWWKRSSGRTRERSRSDSNSRG